MSQDEEIDRVPVCIAKDTLAYNPLPGIILIADIGGRTNEILKSFICNPNATVPWEDLSAQLGYYPGTVGRLPLFEIHQESMRSRRQKRSFRHRKRRGNNIGK
jgi:hypothetical protein